TSGQCTYTCATGYAFGRTCQRCYGTTVTQTCTTDADCCPVDSDQVCVKGMCIAPYGLCQFQPGECRSPLVCAGGVFGVCSPPCKTAADCPKYAFGSPATPSCDGTACYFSCSTASNCP